MKFLVDMPLSPGLAGVLAPQGHDVVHALEIGLDRASDEVIMERTGKRGISLKKGHQVMMEIPRCAQNDNRGVWQYAPTLNDFSQEGRGLSRGARLMRPSRIRAIRRFR